MGRASLIATLALTLAACLSGCSGKPRNAVKSERADNVAASPQAIREVLFDHTRPEHPPSIHVQVLIDSSASMKGFKASLPVLLHAVDEGLSYSRDLYFAVQSKRTCFFSEKPGIFGCQPIIDGVRIPDASGYTNLDQAVKAASNFELTILLTDGVPSGQSSGAACVGSGVDAACVSDALTMVLRGSPGSERSRVRGVWLAPTLAMYQGIYFAEQPISPKDFRARDAEGNVAEDLGVNVRIDNPRTGSDGTLLFNYEGPRFLLAIVIGDVDVSRAFLQEFLSHTSFSNVTTLDQAKQYKGGIAALTPVEIFPSTVPPQDYESCEQEKDAGGRIQGDLINCNVEGANKFRLSCRPKPSYASLLVSQAKTSRALRLQLLAPAKIDNRGGGSVSKVALSGSDTSRLVLNVACNGKQPVRCGTDAARGDLRSVADFQAAANELSSASSSSAQYIQKLSTTRPASQPHKIYGLADLLENFYRRQLPDVRSSFANLEFCEE